MPAHLVRRQVLRRHRARLEQPRDRGVILAAVLHLEPLWKRGQRKEGCHALEGVDGLEGVRPATMRIMFCLVQYNAPCDYSDNMCRAASSLHRGRVDGGQETSRHRFSL